MSPEPPLNFNSRRGNPCLRAGQYWPRRFGL